MEIRSRHTIRRNPPSNQTPRYVEPWVFAPAEANSALGKLERAFFTALDSVDALEDRKAAAAQSGKYTPEGIASDALEFAASKLAPQLKRARLAVDMVREELAAKRATLTLKPSDPADLAGQQRRLWKVDQLKKMSPSERNVFLARDDLDVELRQGILETADFSGALPSDLQRFREQVLRAHHGEEVFAEIGDIEKGIADADRALDAARETIAQEVGGARVFDEAAKPHEQQVGVLWLKKVHNSDGTETVKVFKKASAHEGRWETATEHEIAAGGFHRNYDEWQRAGGVWPNIERKTNAA
jgi:hypothetical protein